MEIDWTRVRRLLLESRTRPTIEHIHDIVDRLPNVKILGWGKYGLFNLWYVIIESASFPAYEGDVLYNMTWAYLVSSYPKKRNRRKFHIVTDNTPPDPFRPIG